MRVCLHCKTRFEPWITSMQRGCSYDCLAELARKDRERKAAEAKKIERATDRAKREALKRLPDLIAEAQREVNRYCRLRDLYYHGRVCISCGASPENKYGGTMDAGHYRSRGSAPQLRYYTPQIAMQCVRCNRDRAGERDRFRAGLVGRIGLEKVEAIEAMNGPANTDRAYLIRIKKVFSKKANRMQRRLA